MHKSIITYILFLGLSLFPIISFAQIDEVANNQNEFMQNEWSMYLGAHSRGLDLGFQFGSFVSIFEKNIYEFQLLNMKYPKQDRIRSVYSFYERSKAYHYGKLNDMGVSRIGMGKQKVLSHKPIWGGVEVRLHYFYGASLGFLKPVYLYVIEDDDKIKERYDPLKHNQDNIFGKAEFFYAIDEISINPGAYLKLGLNFEYSSWNDGIRGLEVGATFDAFLKKNELMVNTTAERFFFTFYLNFHLGKKYSRI